MSDSTQTNAHPRGDSRSRRLGFGMLGKALGSTGAGTALILLAFIILPGVVLGFLCWQAFETEKSYSLERLRVSYGRLAGLAARQLDHQLRNAESRWIAAFDEIVAQSPDGPGPEQIAALADKEPLVARYFVLSAPGRVVYPRSPTGEDLSSREPRRSGADVQEHEMFTRWVAQGERIEYGGGDLDEAIAAYRELLAQIKDPQLRAMTESYIGRAQLKAGNRLEALDTFRRLLHLYPDTRDLNRMYLRFLAQYQIANALEGLGRPAEALDVLLELNRDLLARSDAITSLQYSYYAELIQDVVPRLIATPGLSDPASYGSAFRSLGEQSKKGISERYFLHLLDAELGEMTVRRKHFVPNIRYLSARAEGEPFLLAYRALPDEHATYVQGMVAGQIDLEQLHATLSSTMKGLRSATQGVVAIIGTGGEAVLGAEAATGTVMATYSLAPPFDFWQVAVYLQDVPNAMKRFDMRSTVWQGLIAILLISILSGSYVFIRRARRQAYLSRAQTSFVSNVTHELRTPLASIKMFAELLELQVSTMKQPRRGRLGTSASKHLSIIRQECDRLSRLIDRVLEFSRVERDIKHYRFEDRDVGAVVAQTVEAFRPNADARGFRLQLVLEAGLPALRLDADAISQVLMNLLTNAIQYSKDEKEIRVSARRERETVVIEVADRGIGIDSRDIGRVFDKFYSTWRRMDARTQGGLGLGLALSREIVRAHGGKLSVRSQVGRGSTFTVVLPIPVAPAAETPATPSTVEYRAAEPAGGQRG